jgi:hypothetical protein
VVVSTERVGCSRPDLLPTAPEGITVR